MARKTLKDEKGKEYDVEVPDDDDESDGDTLWLDEEDIEWLRRKRREESETERKNNQSSGNSQSGGSGRVVRIRAKQTSQDSQSTPEKSRRRTLRLA
jgi:hypothetical protein